MFNQRVRRTLDGSSDAAGAQQTADERCLAAAEIAAQRDDHPARHGGRDRGATGFGRGSVGEMQLE